MEGATRKPATDRGAVDARTTARLHLGFIDPSGRDGRFGSIGLSLDAPETMLHLASRAGSGLVVSGHEQGRARAALAVLLARHGIAQAHVLDVAAAVPAHAGLGSGTQLALAIGAAVRALHALPPDQRDDARALARGTRSGVGIGLFEAGGFVLDGGGAGPDHPPRVLARLAVPDTWRVIVARDDRMRGLSGAEERAAFAALSPFPRENVAEISRMILTAMLPALAEDELPRFGAAVGAVQAMLGRHYAPAQGGPFRSPRVAAVLRAAARLGAVGCGQSSWGPTGFAFAHANDAQGIVDELRVSSASDGLDIAVRRALNRGAFVGPRPSSKETP